MSTPTVSCLVKAPISTLYREGKPVEPQPVVGKKFDFTEAEMLAVLKANPKAIQPPAPTNKAPVVAAQPPKV